MAIVPTSESALKTAGVRCNIMIHIRIAETQVDIARCQELISTAYGRAYQISFSEKYYDLDAKIEPWPHRYAMGLVGDELVCTAGLYQSQTYVERFGDVAPEEFQAVLNAAGAAPCYDVRHLREYTKLVVRENFRGHGLARFFMAATHSRHFLQIDTPEHHPAALVFCAKLSILRNLYEPLEIHTRRIKPFPIYRVHEMYASPGDPIESRMIIPELDIPRRWYDLLLPGTYDVLEASVS